MIRLLLLSLFLAFICIMAAGCSRNESDPRTKTAEVTVPSPVWVKTYNTLKCGNMLYAIRRTSDSGFIAAGSTNIATGKAAAWIVKLDRSGKIQWQHAFAKDREDTFYAVRQTADGGYLASGMFVTGSSMPDRVGLLVKFRPDGSEEWQQQYPGFAFRSFIENTGGDFTLTGEQTVLYPARSAIVVANVARDGTSTWQKVYGEGEGQIIQRTADNGHAALAKVWNGRQRESLILKTDPAGEVQWQKHYRGSLNAMAELADGGFFLAGSAGIPPKRMIDAPHYIGGRAVPSGPHAENVQGWVLKLDRAGNEQWQKLYGGVFEDEFTAMRRASDGSFLVLGNTHTYGTGNGDLWLVKLNEEGAVLWQKALGGDKRRFAQDLEMTDDGVVIAAKAQAVGICTEKSLLIKVNSEGDVPACSFLLSGSSNAVAEACADDCAVQLVQRQESAPVQARTFVPTGPVIPAIDPGVFTAGICPPQPKLDVGHYSITLRGSARWKHRLTNLLVNQGAADLSVKEMKITRTRHSGTWMERLWSWIMGIAATSSVSHTCATVGPGQSCNFVIEYQSPLRGETEAQVTILSNDPDVPAFVIPIHLTML